LRLHYTTLGSPHRNAGEVDNAVLIMHGTAATETVLPLAVCRRAVRSRRPAHPAKYYIILRDGIGHGNRPSLDGLHAKIPH